MDGQAAGHRATRQPCGLQSRRITLGTSASPASAGVISSPSTPNTQPARHHVISNTRGCHLVSACLSLLLTPQTEVINLQKQSRWQRVVPDWLLRPSQTPFTVWVTAALSDASCDFIAMSTRCEVGRHSTTTSGE